MYTKFSTAYPTTKRFARALTPTMNALGLELAMPLS
eukprot:SAG31_NODE_655_length_13127_cov_20.616058_9_plen_36_part_00